MPKEFEGCEIIETRMDVIVMPKQDVEFSAPPAPETEEARIKERDRMLDFIQKEGFEMVMNSPEQRCLIVEEGPGIGMFCSLEEIYDYVKKVIRLPILKGTSPRWLLLDTLRTSINFLLH